MRERANYARRARITPNSRYTAASRALRPSMQSVAAVSTPLCFKFQKLIQLRDGTVALRKTNNRYIGQLYCTPCGNYYSKLVDCDRDMLMLQLIFIHRNHAMCDPISCSYLPEYN